MFKDGLLYCEEKCYTYFLLCSQSEGGSQMYIKVTLVVRIATRNLGANFRYYLPLKMFYRSQFGWRLIRSMSETGTPCSQFFKEV